MWYTIGESRELEFVKPYKQVCLTYGDDSKMYINYSRFWTPLTFKRNNNFFFGNQSGINIVDGSKVDPETFFHNHYGEKLLLIRGKKGIDQFGRRQNCFIFALNKVTPSHIREYIITSQLFTLKEIIDNPIEYSILPETTIISEWNGHTKKNNHIVGHPIIYELVEKIYEEDFSAAFNSKYQLLMSKFELIKSSFAD